MASTKPTQIVELSQSRDGICVGLSYVLSVPLEETRADKEGALGQDEPGASAPGQSRVLPCAARQAEELLTCHPPLCFAFWPVSEGPHMVAVSCPLCHIALNDPPPQGHTCLSFFPGVTDVRHDFGPDCREGRVSFFLPLGVLGDTAASGGLSDVAAQLAGHSS